MLRRELILLTIERNYQALVRGDQQALRMALAPNCTWRIATDTGLKGAFALGPDHPDEMIPDVTDLFRNHQVWIIDSVIEGTKAAIHATSELSVDDGEHAMVEFLNLYEFNDEGQIESIVQFFDSALLVRLLEGRGLAKA